MANYQNIAWLINMIQKKESWMLNAGENPCDNFTINSQGIFGRKRNNLSKGISYTNFQSNSENLFYPNDCETFKKMPYDVWNLIFKNIYWNSVKGDEIKNQGIAAIISYENFKSNFSLYKAKLQEMGFVPTPIDYSNLTFSEGLGASLKASFYITDEEVEFINSEILKGNSDVLFKKLTENLQKKDIIYFYSKLFCLSKKEKIILTLILASITSLGVYNLIK